MSRNTDNFLVIPAQIPAKSCKGSATDLCQLYQEVGGDCR